MVRQNNRQNQRNRTQKNQLSPLDGADGARGTNPGQDGGRGQPGQSAIRRGGNRRTQRGGQTGLNVNRANNNNDDLTVMVPEGAVDRRQPRQVVKREVQVQKPKLVPLNNNNIDGGNPAAPRFVSFGVDKGKDLQYQNLLSKILNFGMLSMFTDLTDQATKISLMMVLRQDKQVAGNDIYKVIFKVENPKYVTGVIYYGAEFAVKSGVVDPNPNQIEFLSFGKSVILSNLLSLLSIDQDVVDNRKSLNHVNDTKNSEGLDFNGQSKSAMVEFIQTILSLTQSELKDKKKSMEDCDEDKKPSKKPKDEPLIGSSADFDYSFGDTI